MEADDDDIEEVERHGEMGELEDPEESLRLAMAYLQEKGMGKMNEETGLFEVDDDALQAAFACVHGEDDDILQVDDAALGLSMCPRLFSWKKMEGQYLESMEEILTKMHVPIIQVMTPSSLNPIIPALKPIAEAQRYHAQLEKEKAQAEAKAKADAEAYEQMLAEQGRQIYMNNWGFFDGENFYLRCHAAVPETGSVDVMEFAQSMGKIMLRYPLVGDELALARQGGLEVKMSCWQVEVSLKAQGRKAEKIEAISGDLYDDIRVNLSWWMLEENEEEKDWKVTLLLVLIKKRHRRWHTPWSEPSPFNTHRKKAFPWRKDMQMPKPPQAEEEEKLAKMEPGNPEESGGGRHAKIQDVAPQELCTGVDTEKEDAETISVIVHLDEEVLETLTEHVPFEDIFGADVGPTFLQAFVRTTSGDNRIFWGDLAARVIPEYSTWHYLPSVRRRHLPPDSGVMNPCYYNPALRIRLVKDLPHGTVWGSAFREGCLTTAKLRPPRDPLPWEERQRRRIQALMPPAPPPKPPPKEEAKPKEPSEAEVAVQMCKKVDSSQDAEWAYVVVILQDTLERTARETKTGLEEFFGVRIYENYLEVFTKASGEQYNMIEGYLGARCTPKASSWCITRLWKRSKKGKGKGKDKDKGEKKSVMAIKVELCKAVTNEKWEPVFDRQEVDTTPKIDGVPIVD
mmetsp:Transcript_107607/g.195745  ORF Transcript_107607/g.195745 Transcript_107607/m.195745 type:complete len:682 (+) Transcript_107607:130-2175(+)